jgi:nanoRNase/pAp phosphatase (c-di-AMP/oligoRNAs hydrolase)
VKDIIADGPGYGGGHKLAAGASIPQDREDSFIRNALASLDKYTSGSPKA